eukprot:12908850-Prorocentrum_lima.AAC.1
MSSVPPLLPNQGRSPRPPKAVTPGAANHCLLGCRQRLPLPHRYLLGPPPAQKTPYTMALWPVGS